VRQSMRQASRVLVGELGLGELGALIAEADLLVSNNTGPAHIAAALGTPVVDLYALTNPQHTPWQVRSRVLNHDVPCRNCYKSICPAGHHDCLRKVAPERVAAAALELLQESRELPELAA
jgi:ADP-heptose:LPS heptosyltransferase